MKNLKIIDLECIIPLRRMLYIKMLKKYSNSAINRAGMELIKYNIEDPLVKDSLQIIGEWRDAHSYGLEKLKEQVSIKSKQVGGKNTIVSRLKKLESIKLKLTNTPKMNLSRMQDVGGCRIIVNDMKRLNAIVSRFTKFHKGFDLVEINNYINNPKLTGYRSVHLVFKLKDNNSDNYKILIELQCRTELQHAWATAVETVGFFTNKALKSDQGEEHWKIFFLLVSKIFEYEETQTIGGAKGDVSSIVNELNIHERKHKCINKMLGYHASHKIFNEHLNEAEYFLLILDMLSYKLYVDGFRKDQLEAAQERYLSIERENNPNINAVLVSADSMKDLEFGYQNYFNNTELFLNKLKELMKKYRRK